MWGSLKSLIPLEMIFKFRPAAVIDEYAEEFPPMQAYGFYWSKNPSYPTLLDGFIYNHGMQNKFYGCFGCVIQTTRGAHVLSKWWNRARSSWNVTETFTIASFRIFIPYMKQEYETIPKYRNHIFCSILRKNDGLKQKQTFPFHFMWGPLKNQFLPK